MIIESCDDKIKMSRKPGKKEKGTEKIKREPPVLIKSIICIELNVGSIKLLMNDDDYSQLLLGCFYVRLYGLNLYKVKVE